MAVSNLQPESEQRPRGRVYRGLRMANDYVTSFYQSRDDRLAWRTIETYCMFIGHARSGHSIIGALLDAHPNVVLADEADALAYLAAGFRREQIFRILLSRSARQAAKGRTKAGRGGKTYSYAVPNQWQGHFTTLKVIGDSRAGKSTQRIASDPAILDRLRRCMAGINVKLIHVVRNPYDNISTMMVRGGRSFDNAIEQFLGNCRSLVPIRSRVGNVDLLTLRQEQMIQQPRESLSVLCTALGVEPSSEYLEACAGIIYPSAAKSRYSVDWTPALIERVRREIDRFDFLAGYRYDD